MTTDLFGERGRQIGRGHAGHPGAGPDGETCGTCTWARRQAMTQKTYYKCGHMRGRVTRGAATDIRLKDSACEYWEPDES
jgi:hypothetical protein